MGNPSGINDKILVVVIDALDWNLLNEFDTPYLDSLRKTGLSGRLEAPPIPLTPISMREFLTGNESKYFPNQTSRFNLLASVSLETPTRTIFDDLALVYDVGILELPCMGQIRPIRRFWVAGVTGDIHSNYNARVRACPTGLKAYLKGYPVYGPDFWVDKELQRIQLSFLKEFSRFKYMQAILQDYPCQIIATYCRLLDIAFHKYSRYYKLAKEVTDEDIDLFYNFIDQWVAKLVSFVKPDVVFLFSDHGYDPREKKQLGRIELKGRSYLQDWDAHSLDGTYIISGTDYTGEEERRVFQLHGLLKEICGFGFELESKIAKIKAQLQNIKMKPIAGF